MAFKGKAPGQTAGEMSKRTLALRPAIMLSPKEVQHARSLRRTGLSADVIAQGMGKPLDEVEKALVQMRMPRPESTRGTLNVTLAAHGIVLAERRGDEPLWQTFDRIVDEFLKLRAAAGRGGAKPAAWIAQRSRPASAEAEFPLLPGF